MKGEPARLRVMRIIQKRFPLLITSSEADGLNFPGGLDHLAIHINYPERMKLIASLGWREEDEELGKFMWYIWKNKELYDWWIL